MVVWVLRRIGWRRLTPSLQPRFVGKRHVQLGIKARQLLEGLQWIECIQCCARPKTGRAGTNGHTRHHKFPFATQRDIDLRETSAHRQTWDIRAIDIIFLWIWFPLSILFDDDTDGDRRSRDGGRGRRNVCNLRLTL